MSPEPPPAEPFEAARPSASPPKESEPSGTGVIAGAMPGATHETNELWIGNDPTHMGKDSVMAAFAPHEALDCVVKHAGSRSHAFLFFRSIVESQAALEALRGSKVKCAFIRIEFAQPIKKLKEELAKAWTRHVYPLPDTEPEEFELLALAANRALQFIYNEKSILVPNAEAIRI